MSYDRTLLTAEALRAFLDEHPGWVVENGMLRRTYQFPTFAQAIAFVDRVAVAADAQDHHPDIDIRYRKVTLALSTHDAGGLTFRDPQLAAEADRLAQA